MPLDGQPAPRDNSKVSSRIRAIEAAIETSGGTIAAVGNNDSKGRGGGTLRARAFPRLDDKEFEYVRTHEGRLLNGKCVKGKAGTFAEHICSKPDCQMHGHLAKDHIPGTDLTGTITTV